MEDFFCRIFAFFLIIFVIICILSHFSSKKALQDFFQSLKAKKQPNIQHYHVHYYPMPYSMLTWPKVPVKRDLEKLYEYVRTFNVH